MIGAATIDVARPGGAARLGEEVFEIADAGRSMSFAYRDVEQIRLSYRPRSLDYRVFRLDLRMRDGRSVTLHNVATSAGALFKPHERWDKGYVLFARGLAERVAAAAPDARLLAGFPLWRFWPATAVGAALCVFLVARAATALLAGDGMAALIAVGGLAVALVFLAPFLWRNRPRRFSGGAIPADVLP
ncbi:MAG: hypothetical protein JNK46_01665 [Methylobacteriaceae bacterium]|nr:hypothetical protein [Methylobacteriaceae bacterium]